METGPCDICGCSLEVHGERMLCPYFFNGNFYGWQETHYYNSELLQQVAELRNKVIELEKENKTLKGILKNELLDDNN